jgi:hypothetical protein
MRWLPSSVAGISHTGGGGHDTGVHRYVRMMTRSNESWDLVVNFEKDGDMMFFLYGAAEVVLLVLHFRYKMQFAVTAGLRHKLPTERAGARS